MPTALHSWASKPFAFKAASSGMRYGWPDRLPHRPQNGMCQGVSCIHHLKQPCYILLSPGAREPRPFGGQRQQEEQVLCAHGWPVLCKASHRLQRISGLCQSRDAGMLSERSPKRGVAQALGKGMFPLLLDPHSEGYSHLSDRQGCYIFINKDAEDSEMSLLLSDLTMFTQTVAFHCLMLIIIGRYRGSDLHPHEAFTRIF